MTWTQPLPTPGGDENEWGAENNAVVMEIRAAIDALPNSYVQLPASTERIMYVTPRGDDANDGLSLKSAKASIGAALSAGATFVQLGYGTHSADVTSIAPLTTAGQGVTIAGIGQRETIISYAGAGFAIDVESATPTSVPAALVGIHLQDLTIDGGGNTTSGGGIKFNGAYNITIDRVYVTNFAKSGAVGISLGNAFNTTFRDLQVNNIPNGIGVDLTGVSGDAQLTQIQLFGFEIQSCSVALRVSPAQFGEGLWLADGAMTLPANGIGIQFTGSYGEVRVGPNVHIECYEPVATNTSTAVQAVSGAALNLDTVTFDGMTVYNTKTIFDLDGSTGHIGTVDWNRVYASALSGLAGTAFKLNKVLGAYFGPNLLIPSTTYTTPYSLTNTTALWQRSPVATASLPAASASNVGREFLITDSSDTARDLVRISSGTDMRRIVTASSSGAVALPGALVWSNDVKITHGTGSPAGVLTANGGSLYLQDDTGDLWQKTTPSGDNTSGWYIIARASNTRTVAQLGSAANLANTAGKRAGSQIWVSDASKPAWATGTNATDPWVYADGTTCTTPS